MALLVTGLREAFKEEADTAISSIGGDAWVVPVGREGPFTEFYDMGRASVERIGAVPGVRRAGAVSLLPVAIHKGSDLKILTVVGHELGGLGEPLPDEGRRARAPGEVVADRTLGFHLGQTLKVQGHRFKMVGLVSGLTFGGGNPLVYLPREDLEALVGTSVTKAVVIRGTPRASAGLKVLSRAQVRDDLLRPLQSADSAINNTRLLLWLVAAAIVGAVMYMSALERVRDFAVLKAVGATTRTLVFSLATEAVIACLLAAALAIGFAQLLLPIFPLPITFTVGAYAVLPVVAVVVGVVTSLAGVRRAVRTRSGHGLRGYLIANLQIHDPTIDC